ncbi:MAG: alcohol dehydrogenase catalytic domain-containing protein [Desulfobacterales bacterium]|jgi:(R,R)-butanediol dehydrogenase/meso-butanediol dehydrogenase/diacetyl reductase|nr:alcohol dehydrogenase catalytic domain-containing protein [Desulfobacterales bacterium]
MKAALWYNQKDICVEDIPVTGVLPGHVKIKIKCCGIYGSDFHEYMAGPILIMTKHPHPLTGIKSPPVVMGHEFVGEVIEIGSQASKFQIGDRVAVAEGFEELANNLDKHYKILVYP